MVGRQLLSGGLACAAAVAVALVSSPIAHADTGLSDAFVILGTAAIYGDGAVGVTAGTCPDPADVLGGEATAHVDLMGGCGSFTFSTSACAMWSDGDPVLPLETGVCSAAVSATFANTVCGTGGAIGSASLTGPENATATFAIAFVGTVVVLTGTATDTSGDGAGQSDDSLVGVVQLGPAQGGGPLPDGPLDCTSAITVTLAATAYDPL